MSPVCYYFTNLLVVCQVLILILLRALELRNKRECNKRIKGDRHLFSILYTNSGDTIPIAYLVPLGFLKYVFAHADLLCVIR